MLRFCLPRVRDAVTAWAMRLLPWARALLASQVLDAQLLPPAFGSTVAAMADFRHAADDWIYQRAHGACCPRCGSPKRTTAIMAVAMRCSALQRFRRAHVALRARHGYVLRPRVTSVAISAHRSCARFCSRDSLPESLAGATC